MMYMFFCEFLAIVKIFQMCLSQKPKGSCPFQPFFSQVHLAAQSQRSLAEDLFQCLDELEQQVPCREVDHGDVIWSTYRTITVTNISSD